jgi:hypothetical protein
MIRKKENSTRKKSVASSKRWNKNVSPVGWYVASYVLRFVELGWKNINDSDARFLTWENTVLVKARSLEHAYDKTVAIAKEHTEPYKGGPKRVDVQWLFEGVTQVLPVYEEIQDGAEIMWAEYTRKLKNIRKLARTKRQLPQ